MIFLILFVHLKCYLPKCYSPFNHCFK